MQFPETRAFCIHKTFGGHHVIVEFFFLQRVDSNFVIKVADFGLSVILGPEEECFQQKDEDSVKLPMKWLAIESINERMFSEKTDVVCKK